MEFQIYPFPFLWNQNQWAAELCTNSHNLYADGQARQLVHYFLRLSQNECSEWAGGGSSELPPENDAQFASAKASLSDEDRPDTIIRVEYDTSNVISGCSATKDARRVAVNERASYPRRIARMVDQNNG